MDENEKDRRVAGLLDGLNKSRKLAFIIKYLLPYLTSKSDLYPSRSLHPYDVMVQMGGLDADNLGHVLDEVFDRGCLTGFMRNYKVSKTRAYAIYNEELGKAGSPVDHVAFYQGVVSRITGTKHRARASEQAAFKCYHGALMMSIHQSRLPGHLMPRDGEFGLKYRIKSGRDIVMVSDTFLPGFTSTQLMLLCGIWSVAERRRKVLENASTEIERRYEARVHFRLRDLMMVMTGREWSDVSDAVKKGFSDELRSLVKLLNQSGGHVTTGRESYPLSGFFFQYSGDGIDFSRLTGNEEVVMDDPYGRRYVQGCGNAIDVPAGLIGSMRCDDFKDVCARLYIIYRVLVSRYLKSKSIDRREFEREFGSSYRLMRTTMLALKDAHVIESHGFTSSAISWSLSPWKKEKDSKKENDSD